MQFSKEYVGAIAILVVSILGAFGVEVVAEDVTNLIVGVIALVVAISRKAKGDINVLGIKAI